MIQQLNSHGLILLTIRQPRGRHISSREKWLSEVLAANCRNTRESETHCSKAEASISLRKDIAQGSAQCLLLRLPFWMEPREMAGVVLDLRHGIVVVLLQ